RSELLPSPLPPWPQPHGFTGTTRRAGITSATTSTNTICRAIKASIAGTTATQLQGF
ncbi:hypothetical protein GGF37_005493, partial [Kickxella alabastrina]